MNKTPSISRQAIFALCVLSPLFLASSQAQAAGGAYVVDDAEIGKPGDCKVESWISYADNKDFNAVTSPACVFNIGRPVELTTQFQRMRSGGDWSTALTLKAKTNLIPVEGNPFGLALIGNVILDLSGGDNPGASISVPVTFKVSDQFKVNLNAGWLREASDHLDWFTWGAGFEWAFVKPFTLIGEVFGQTGASLPADMPGSVRDPRAQLGLRYTPVENIDVDLIYGRNIMGEDANWVTLGLNVRF